MNPFKFRLFRLAAINQDFVFKEKERERVR
jgi:hypothetical protein